MLGRAGPRSVDRADRALRVLHVIDGLGSSGGAENRLVDEVEQLSPNTQQLVVRLFEYDHLDSRLRSSDIEVRALGLASSRGSYNWPLAVVRLRTVIRQYRPDVVHTSLFAANLAGQLAARLCRVPVVSTMTLTADPSLLSTIGYHAASRRATAMRRLASGAARLSSARWRAITEDAKFTNCRSLGIPPERVTVIYRGVDARWWQAAADPGRFGLPPGPLLVNVARHAPQKGHVMLVEAFSSVVAAVPDAQLAIAGRFGVTTPMIRDRITELGLDGRVHLLGYRSDSEVLLAGADLFVYSSLAEGLGTAVLEALAAGLPVVAFDIPPVREITGDGTMATLVSAGGVGALAAATLASLTSPEPADAASLRQTWVKGQFELAGVARQLEGLLRSVAGR